MQTSLQRALARRGIHVSLCADGLQAITQWQALQPDVMGLDLSLPGRDGLEVLAALRALHATTPVSSYCTQHRGRPGAGPERRGRRLPGQAL